MKTFSGIRSRIVKKGNVSQTLRVPSAIKSPPYVHNPSKEGFHRTNVGAPEIKTLNDITVMRNLGILARKLLDYSGSLVQVGRTTDEIDKLTHERIIQSNAYLLSSDC